jgi:hypothetical protein
MMIGARQLGTGESFFIRRSAMTSVNKGVLCALALVVALGAQIHQARAQDRSDGPAITLAMTPAPLGTDVVAPLAEPVLLCGNVWVRTTYVIPQNCYKACINKGHSPAECNTKWVPMCRACWRQLLTCARSPAIPPAARCHECTSRYENCMWTFLHSF